MPQIEGHFLHKSHERWGCFAENETAQGSFAENNP